MYHMAINVKKYTMYLENEINQVIDWKICGFEEINNKNAYTIVHNELVLLTE